MYIPWNDLESPGKVTILRLWDVYLSRLVLSHSKRLFMNRYSSLPIWLCASHTKKRLVLCNTSHELAGFTSYIIKVVLAIALNFIVWLWFCSINLFKSLISKKKKTLVPNLVVLQLQVYEGEVLALLEAIKWVTFGLRYFRTWF